MSIRSWLAIAIAVAVCPGCVGEAPPALGGDPPDASTSPPRADASPDAPDGDVPEPTTLDVTGTVRDYWSDDRLEGTDLMTDGVDPTVTATSESGGLYALTDLPAASAFYVRASRASGYRVTVNEPVFVVDQSVVKDLYVVSQVDAQRQHVTAGLTVEADTAIVVAELLRADDSPMAGVPAANITLADDGATPVGAGPYFLGELGDVDLALAASTEFGGRVRVVFLNVPAGFATLTAVDDVDGEVALRTLVRPAGAHLLRVGGAGDAAPSAAAPRFDQDVYPILQSAARGGSGCGNCHRAGGPAAGFRFDDDEPVVYQSVTTRAGVVNAGAPETSLLLTAPLYEDPPNHPNATWLDTATADYQTILLWIQQGAQQ